VICVIGAIATATATISTDGSRLHELRTAPVASNA
jgi:MHS family shikimate/dehydroshikimate transporter-like MFS transporter